MFGRAFCAGLALVCSSSADTGTPNTLPVAHYPLVHQIICAKSKGTAFRIGKNEMLSVAHVTSNTGCTIDGIGFNAKNDGDKDFSILDYPVAKLDGFKINCDGFIPGEWYFAVGYAGGHPWQTMVRILATYVKTGDGLRVLLGSPTVIPGMSGGPVLNKRGEVVGTINKYSRIAPLSLSRALRDTEVCNA